MPGCSRSGAASYLGPVMQHDAPAEFDAFYKAARDRLLLQTYALTGDLVAARSAVRDAYVVAWHHWRKLSRLGDPESSVRPHAWRHAQRRATVRPWHKEKGLDRDNRATLEALAALTNPQRRALLLTQLAAVSMEDMAREIGLQSDDAQRVLQNAASQFASQKNIPASSIPMTFAALATATTDVTWPRVTILRRAGAARRRMHTVVGAGAVVAALVASGAAVTDATGVRPTLDREQVAGPAGNQAAPGPEIVLPETSLLPGDVVRRTLIGDWAQGPTHDNSVGNGVVLPCQPEDADSRYADPRGTAAWVRVFRNGPAGESPRKLTEVVEASAQPRAGPQDLPPAPRVGRRLPHPRRAAHQHGDQPGAWPTRRRSSSSTRSTPSSRRTSSASPAPVSSRPPSRSGPTSGPSRRTAEASRSCSARPSTGCARFPMPAGAPARRPRSRRCRRTPPARCRRCWPRSTSVRGRAPPSPGWAPRPARSPTSAPTWTCSAASTRPGRGVRRR